MIDDSGFNGPGEISEESKRSCGAVRPQTDFGDETNKSARSPRARAVTMVIAAMALPVATFVFARCWSVLLYLANDDVGMELLLRGGGVTSRPTAFVQFMHVGLGEVLVWLYARASGLSWYQVLMNGILVLAGMTVSWAAVRRGLNWNRLVLITVYCLGFLLTFFVQPNFSISAAIATQAAMVLWFGEIAEGRALTGLRMLAFIGLVLIGGMIRIDACLLQVAVAVPVALWLAFGVRHSAPLTRASPPEAGGEGNARKSHDFGYAVRMVIPPLVIAGGITGLLRVSQSYVYGSSPGWEHFEEFNKLRAQFTDYQAAPFSDENRAVYERAGWTQNDYEMLMRWFFENPQLYNIEKFKAVLSQAPRPAEVGGKQFTRLLEQVKNDPGMRLMVVGACISVLFVGWRGGLAGFGIVALTVAGAMIAVMMVLHRLPPWFSGPLLAFVPGIAVILPSPESSTVGRPCHNDATILPSPALLNDRLLTVAAQPARMAIQVMALGLFGWGLVSALAEWRQKSAMISQARTNFLTSVVELQRRPDRIYVAWGGVFPYELIVDNEDFRTISRLRLIALGCLSQTPINNERLRELGIDDLYHAMFVDPRVQVICHGDSGAHFMRYVHEHYGKQTRGHVLEAKPLGEYPIFDPIEGRYDLKNRVFWLQEFRERNPKNEIRNPK
jgi:hypothetical protein